VSGTRRYQVQTRQQDGQWSNEVGEANVFTSEAEAEEAITELRALGDGWRVAIHGIAHKPGDTSRDRFYADRADAVGELTVEFNLTRSHVRCLSAVGYVVSECGTLLILDYDQDSDDQEGENWLSNRYG